MLSLILPYALIPNNSPQYRVFALLLRLAGLAAIGVQLLIEKVPPGPDHRRRWAEGQGINARMAATVDRHCETIVRKPPVGVAGVDGLSLAKLCDGRGLDVVSFDQRRNGVLRRAEDLCEALGRAGTRSE